jgi:hypothetical protein
MLGRLRAPVAVGFPGGCSPTAAIAQLGERQTEDLKVPGSIPGLGSFVFLVCVVMCLRGCVRDGVFCCGGVCVWHDGIFML